ncbi:MAG TPA: hypothetical protein PKB13_05660, partial [Clostridia bacterium]|nr:hypothetical protein [Clostridia bacterium]
EALRRKASRRHRTCRRRRLKASGSFGSRTTKIFIKIRAKAYGFHPFGTHAAEAGTKPRSKRLLGSSADYDFEY